MLRGAVRSAHASRNLLIPRAPLLPSGGGGPAPEESRLEHVEPRGARLSLEPPVADGCGAR
eukprot:2318556-Alexandrium_andersonii.AAC.1